MLTINRPSQMSLYDIYSDLSELAYDKPHAFFGLLKEHFDLSAFIPQTFKSKYYSWLGRDREISLESTLSALLVMHFLKIPTTILLCTFLAFSCELRSFCALDRIPGEYHFSRFKSHFSNELELFMQELVKHALTICAEIESSLPKDHALKGAHQKLIFDTSGVKPRVKENNPKFIASEVKKYKTYAKTIDNKDFNPYAAAYNNLPKEAGANPEFRLDYLNGHFAYFYKFGMITNGFGIPLHLHFFDKDFYEEVDKLSAAPDTSIAPEELKNLTDNASLKPVAQAFAKSHDIHQFTEFLADAEFDSYDNFALLKELEFEKVIIPLNPRNSSKTTSDKLAIPYDDDGWPLCPKTLDPMNYEGPCRGKSRSLRYKFTCPETVSVQGIRICNCEDPCTTSPCGRMHYVYPHKDFRLYPGIIRGSEEWDTEYKLRATIERSFSSLKSNECVAEPRSLSLPSIKSDLYLAACTQVITVILAYAIKKPEFFRSISKVIKFVS